MKEAILARFFEGRITAATLAGDLNGSETHVTDTASTVEIEDMPEDFVVSREMALRLCDAVIDGELSPDSLSSVGFALMASDKFVWDGEDVLGDVIADWAAPEINYDLNIENVRKFRSWLQGTEGYPAARHHSGGTRANRVHSQ